MLMVANFEPSPDIDRPAGRSGEHYVKCSRPANPEAYTVDEVVDDIIKYATGSTGAVRMGPRSLVDEYLVEFESEGGFVSEPIFRTRNQLEFCVKNILGVKRHKP